MRNLKRNLFKATRGFLEGYKRSCSKPSVLKTRYSTWDKFSSSIHLNEIRNCYALGTEFLPSDAERRELKVLAPSLARRVCWAGYGPLHVIPASHWGSSGSARISSFSSWNFCWDSEQLSFFEVGPESRLLPLSAPEFVRWDIFVHVSVCFIVHIWG